jgi:hypothetical protein
MKNIIKEGLKGISEAIDPNKIDLSSFEVKKELNPSIWEPDGKLKPAVKEQLLKIADDFKDFLEIDWVDYSDVIITGSLANYNWSKFSDIDLHIIINRNDVDTNRELVDEYLDAKKKLWSEEHDIKIYGFDVECYAQDINEKHTSSGVYSIEKNKWIIEPSKEKPKLDKNLIKRKAAQIMTAIDSIKSLNSKGKHQEVLDQYEKLWGKIKKMRQTGLDRDGEFSYENIVFKILRRTNYTEKLIDTKLNSYDNLNSIK